MKSGQITKAVQSIFKIFFQDVKITSTSFRKVAVMKVHMDKPEISGKLADLMAHNEATAKKYYVLSKKSKMLVDVLKNLGRLMRIDDGDKDTATKETTVGEKKRKLQGSEQANSLKTTQSKRINWQK